MSLTTVTFLEKEGKEPPRFRGERTAVTVVDSATCCGRCHPISRPGAVLPLHPAPSAQPQNWGMFPSAAPAACGFQHPPPGGGTWHRARSGPLPASPASSLSCRPRLPPPCALRRASRRSLQPLPELPLSRRSLSHCADLWGSDLFFSDFCAGLMTCSVDCF